MNTTKESIEAVAATLGITMTVEFVPWSKSRNKGEKLPSLNWTITLHKVGKAFLTTDYMTGMGHCPSYKQGRLTTDQDANIRKECETGHTCRDGFVYRGKPILPSLADVLPSLASDAEAIDCGTFEAWADNYGMDTDSRKAEATYRACLEIGLKLRAALGEDGLKTLREAVQDY